MILRIRNISGEQEDNIKFQEIDNGEWIEKVIELQSDNYHFFITPENEYELKYMKQLGERGDGCLGFPIGFSGSKQDNNLEIR